MGIKIGMKKVDVLRLADNLSTTQNKKFINFLKMIEMVKFHMKMN